MKSPTKVATALIKSTFILGEMVIKTLQATTAIAPIISGVNRIRSAVISKITPRRNKISSTGFCFLNIDKTMITSQAILNTPQTSFRARPMCVSNPKRTPTFQL